MARYFFDCFDGKRLHSDLYGIELSSSDEIADHGACLAREILREVTDSTGTHGISVMVRSADGAHVYVAHCGFHGVLIPAPYPD